MKLALPRNFRFSPLISLFCVALAVLMVRAARWQWDRYLYKTALVETYRGNSQALPIRLPVDGNDEILHAHLNRKVYLEGEYDFDHQIVVMNQRHRTGPGYWLMTPFKPEGSPTHFMVSRGFIPYADATPESWKKYEFSRAERVEAVVQESVRHRSALAPDSLFGASSEGFPRKWLYPDLERIAESFPYPIHSGIYLQRLGSPPRGEFPAESISIRVPPSTHFGYTIEWTLLACATLTVGFLLQAFPRKRRQVVLTALVLAALQFTAPNAAATDKPENVPQAAQVLEHLGGTVSLDTEFVDQDGKSVRLQDYVSPGHPLIIAPVYYECPRLCTLTQQGLTDALKQLELKLFADYRVVSISFNPNDTPEFAKRKAQTYHEQLAGDSGARAGWQFLTGTVDNTRKVMSELGFQFAPDAGEFLHPAVLMVLTPDGRISRYLYGIRYLPQDVKLALLEASNGTIGTVMDRILLYCFRYDHLQGRYTFAIMAVVNVISSAVFLGLMACLISLRMKEKRRLAPQITNY